MTAHDAFPLAFAPVVVLFSMIWAGIGARYLPPPPLAFIVTEIVMFVAGIAVLAVMS